jgi:hypothetical protein
MRLTVPFYRYTYDPELEIQCINEFVLLSKRLSSRGFESNEIIWLNHWLIYSLKEIDSIDNLSRSEQKQRNTLFSDLSDIFGLPKIISERIIDHLKDKTESHCAILLRRAHTWADGADARYSLVYRN